MNNPEQPGESDPSQRDQPYEQLSPFTQVAAEYIAAGYLDPSISPEDVREIDSLLLETLNKIKHLVYEYLSNHDELPQVTGMPPEWQLAARLFEMQYHNETPPPPDTPQ